MQQQLTPFLSQKIRFFSFLAMILLVFVHGYNLNERYLQPFTLVNEPLTFTTFTEYFLANGLFRFRIPLLFIISGYLLAMNDERPYMELLKKKFKTLMVPYFLWSTIGLGTAVALSYWSLTSEAVQAAHLQPVQKPFADYTAGDWLSAILWPTSFQLWFIRCLFVYNLLYPVLRSGLSKIPWLLFSLFTLMWLGTIGFVVIEGEGLLFFSLGIWLYKRRKNISYQPSKIFLVVMATDFILLTVLKTWLAFEGLTFMDWIPLTITLMLLHKAVIALGLLVAWFSMDAVVTYFMKRRWFANLTDFSFMIYALHVPLVTYLIDPVFHLLQPFQHYRFITFIFLPIALIAFSIVTGMFLRNVTPSLYALLTGNRGLRHQSYQETEMMQPEVVVATATYTDKRPASSESPTLVS
jgi:fucose 4-O-acetylase-like acetyltransferase